MTRGKGSVVGIPPNTNPPPGIVTLNASCAPLRYAKATPRDEEGTKALFHVNLGDLGERCHGFRFVGFLRVIPTMAYENENRHLTSDIYSGILSALLSDIYSDILFDINSDNLAFHLIYAGILSGIFRHSICHTF